jgi:CDGSH-type Zn-finger protein
MKNEELPLRLFPILHSSSFVSSLLTLHSSLKTIMATKLTVLSNGSLRVEGEDIELVDAQGQPYGLGGRQRISICRCGLSKQKPFCDGSHKGHFEHDATAFDLPAPKPSV